MSLQRPLAISSVLTAAILTLVGFSGVAYSEQPTAPLIVQRVDESIQSRLTGNVSGRVAAEHDTGSVPGTLHMDDLALVLKRSPVQERALQQLLASLQDPKSALYHRWLTPSQFGAQFGANNADIAILSAWLKAHGFVVKPVSHGRNLLPFSGTATQVETAFNTQIHAFERNGERHWANVTDPLIPQAFAPAIAGIVGLHNFAPAPQHRTVTATEWTLKSATPQFNAGTANTYGVGPADFSTIYNVQPLLNKGITGRGVKIAIVARSDVSASLVSAYWSTFGAQSNPTFTTLVPTGAADPGETANGDETEADLDVEVAGGVAPDSTLILIPSSSLGTSITYAIDNNVAPIVSISFGECEADLTAAGNAQIATLYQEANTLGITVVVASGDQGSATCDTGDTTGPAAATQGLAVNGLASTPYNTAIGGTDFNFVGATESQYWSTSNTSAGLASALSYMPEMVWNSSCANPILLQVLPSYSSLEAICNNPSFAGGVIVGGGGGGLSSVYAQPSWQTGVEGLSGGTSRAIPDISFFASNGFSGVSWVICSYVNTTCDPGGSAGAADGYDLIGGTSASTPAFAGIMALLLQTQVSPSNPDGRQGLINATLYQLAANEFGTAQTPNSGALGSCNSSNGNAVGSACIFYDITTGSNAQPCTTGSVNCMTQTNGDAYGVLTLNGSNAFDAAPGFDAATGLGSLNVANFITALWVPLPPTALTATPGNGTVALQWGASNLAQTYNVYQGTSAGGESASPVLTGVAGTTTNVASLTNGQVYFFRVAAVNGGGTSAYSTEATATVLPSTPTALTATASDGSVTLSWTASIGANSYSVYQGTSAGGEGVNAVRSGVTGITTTISGLSDGQTYYFKVAAVNAGGVSVTSNESSATPTAPTGGGGGIGTLELLSLMSIALFSRRMYLFQLRRD